MPSDRVVVIGAGVNGLTTAAYLAKAGVKPLVLERREVIGGLSVTEEFHPDYRCSPVSSLSGALPAKIVRDLGLDGVEILRSGVRVFAPSADGRALLLYEDSARTAEELLRRSKPDASRWGEFAESLRLIGRFLEPLLWTTPPSPDEQTLPDVLGLLGAVRGFRALPRREAWRLLRWGPMAVADFASEWFEDERLRAVVAARGIRGMAAGPWSAGTTANLLLSVAGETHPAGPSAVVRGGMGAVSAAIASAAARAGAVLRTGAEVARILIHDGRASGVVLVSGEEIPARAVVSSADPKRTFLGLLDPMELDPDFTAKIGAYRSNGAAAKVHLALSGLPFFPSLSNSPATSAALSARIHVGDSLDDLERAFDSAKYGVFSDRPWCEVTIPSLSDPALAPAGSHVMSVHVQYAPSRLRDGGWDERREALGDVVVRTLETVCPGLSDRIVGRKVITPRDIEQTYGVTGGHLGHGEHALDQLWAARPLLGWARYRTPVAGLYLCGAGTHPGGGATGACGANASREILKSLREV
jgi:phytoene dehydrogenase-like protein